MSRMKDLMVDIVDLVGNGYHSNDKIAKILAKQYGISEQYVLECIEVVIQEWM